MVTERGTLPDRLAPGRTLGGRYRLDRRLGVGGMASVWLADDGVLGRQVAAKVIADTLAGEGSWLRRFQREARAIAALNHPNVVRVFDLGSDRGRPFIVMQYVSGGNLAQRLDSGRALDGRRIAGELLAGVGHIHASGLLHRDIKPGNILIAQDGGVMLTDFGLARLPDATQLTATGDVLGTARYMAPELLRGAPATVASDLFACGRVIADAERTLGPDSALADLIGELTADEPEARPRSAKAAMRLLDESAARPRRATRLLDESAARPRRATRPTATGRGRSLSRAAAIALIALTALVALVLVIAASEAGRPDGSRVPSPAARSAPLQAQLDALQRQVRAAGGR